MISTRPSILPFDRLGMGTIAQVGGKNASLGEMIVGLRSAGINVPEGFAVTVSAYHDFLDHNGLTPFIREQIASATDSDAALAYAGKSIRSAVLAGEMPEALARDISAAYLKLCEDAGISDLSVAVRSSATAEDLPDASFAGQQDTYLCVRGAESVVANCIRCFASLFTDRAILYRAERNLGDVLPEISVGIQRMVRSDLGAAGVAFSIDTETGFPDSVLINGAWGLGETVVQGAVDPDEFMVFKPFLAQANLSPVISKSLGGKQEKMVCVDGRSRVTTEVIATPEADRNRFCLDDSQLCRLASWVTAIESHYGCPMDTEWAVDGETGELFIVQARPETVHSRRTRDLLKSYEIGDHGETLVSGVAIGDGAVTGSSRRLASYTEASGFRDGEILVTDMTDPNWLPVMRRASAIVTDRGGRTSHAAIVSRELGLPAITGASGATEKIGTGRTVTVACCEGATGHVYDGTSEVTERSESLDDIPETRTQVMLNLADPSSALRWWSLPSDGVGLARMEFIISNHIKAHPLALARYPDLPHELCRDIAALTEGYDDKRRFFIEQLSRGIAMIAASVWPRPIIVRTSDFKTNEYADLLGGPLFEPDEQNPMIGWRGASRYIHPEYEDAFALECAALHRVRNTLGFTNVKVMVPFCRTPEEGRKVVDSMGRHGLVQGRDGLEIYAMCEIPSNVILVDEFASVFDGFSIGSNDLTQLILGIDRDGERMSHLFDENNPAVRKAIESVIEGAHRRGRKVGLCGQGPSDNPAFAHFLAAAGIDSISVTPDSFVRVKENIKAAEQMPAYGVSAAE